MLVAAEAEEGVRAWIDEMVWRDFYHAILDAHSRVRCWKCGVRSAQEPLVRYGIARMLARPFSVPQSRPIPA